MTWQPDVFFICKWGQPLTSEGCWEHHLHGLHLEWGTSWPFPGQGPDLPLPLSLSHSPPPPQPPALSVQVNVSMCAHVSSGFQKGGGQVVEKQDELVCDFISVVLLSSCHSKSILRVTL